MALSRLGNLLSYFEDPSEERRRFLQKENERITQLKMYSGVVTAPSVPYFPGDWVKVKPVVRLLKLSANIPFSGRACVYRHSPSSAETNAPLGEAKDLSLIYVANYSGVPRVWKGQMDSRLFQGSEKDPDYGHLIEEWFDAQPICTASLPPGTFVRPRGMGIVGISTTSLSRLTHMPYCFVEYQGPYIFLRKVGGDGHCVIAAIDANHEVTERVVESELLTTDSSTF